MIDLGSFHFLRPFWLLLIPVAVWLWWCRRVEGDPLRGWRVVLQPELLDALTVGQGHRTRRLTRDVPLLLGWLLAVIAVAGPTWRPEPSPSVNDPPPVMIVLKAGESMNQTDLMPTRMERARLKVADFAEAAPARPLGLIAYAGTPHLVLPPTRDAAVVSEMAAELDPEIMPKAGDDLAAALTRADEVLGTGGGSILVIADSVTGNASSLAEYRTKSKRPVGILAVARPDTPELDTLNDAARSIDATISRITPDSSDIDRLIRRSTEASVAAAAEGDEIRWSEAGRWLVPVLAAIVLGSFRRQNQDYPREGA
ncbi:VWA domain-containing protein [Stieleria mannarensis]|uniref:VWA domain-containing protein n=1 Tax=Stieleria mannarensis TaxID=2755585 RepID=UPI0016025E91|nr:VWA domain-containing protein [Rhodopirellula sp. JC639]